MNSDVHVYLFHWGLVRKLSWEILIYNDFIMYSELVVHHGKTRNANIVITTRKTNRSPEFDLIGCVNYPLDSDYYKGTSCKIRNIWFHKLIQIQYYCKWKACDHNWRLWRQGHVSMAWANNYISYYCGGRNYLCMPQIYAYDSKDLNLVFVFGDITLDYILIDMFLQNKKLYLILRFINW